MKKVLTMIICICLLFSAVPTLAEDDVLTAEPWKSTAGVTLTLKSDGTGELLTAQSMTYNGTWTLNIDTLTFTYQLYGTRNVVLSLAQEGGIPCLKGPDGSIYYPQSRYAEATGAAGGTSNAYSLPLGEPVELGYVTIKLERAQLLRKVIGSSNIGIVLLPEAGMQYFSVIGTFRNGTGGELPMNRISAELVFDNQYTYTAQSNVEYNGQLTDPLPALGQGTYYLTAKIPDSLASSYTAVTVRFGFNDAFATMPQGLNQCDFLFETVLDSKTLQDARKEPVRDIVYFAECPILPAPQSYADVYESGSGTSSVNGKVSGIRYSYSPNNYGDAIDPLLNQYLDGLRAANFTVKKSGTSYEISANSKKLATISTTAGGIKVELVPGNEKLTQKPAANQTETPKTYSHIGDTLRPTNATLKLETSGKATVLNSYLSKQPNYYRYIEPQTGNQLFFVRGTFKNTGGREIDIRNIYTEFTFDGKYVYNGDVTALLADGTRFENDVQAQESMSCYIYAEVPSHVLSSYKSCILKIGFTDDFSYKVLKNNGYNFDLCSKVYEIDLSKTSTKPTAKPTIKPTTKTKVTPSPRPTATPKRVEEYPELVIANYGEWTWENSAHNPIQMRVQLTNNSSKLTVTGYTLYYLGSNPYNLSDMSKVKTVHYNQTFVPGGTKYSGYFTVSLDNSRECHVAVGEVTYSNGKTVRLDPQDASWFYWTIE